MLTPAPASGAQALGLASTSMVLASCCPAGGVSALPSLTPALKPLTAPPRSAPMLRSFLVPNTSMMITRTISQCQMLIEPITQLPCQCHRGAQKALGVGLTSDPTATAPGRPSHVGEDDTPPAGPPA